MIKIKTLLLISSMILPLQSSAIQVIFSQFDGINSWENIYLEVGVGVDYSQYGVAKNGLLDVTSLKAVKGVSYVDEYSGIATNGHPGVTGVDAVIGVTGVDAVIGVTGVNAVAYVAGEYSWTEFESSVSVTQTSPSSWEFKDNGTTLDTWSTQQAIDDFSIRSNLGLSDFQGSIGVAEVEAVEAVDAVEAVEAVEASPKSSGEYEQYIPPQIIIVVETSEDINIVISEYLNNHLVQTKF